MVFQNGTKSSTFFHTRHLGNRQDVSIIRKRNNTLSYAIMSNGSKSQNSSDPLLVPKALGDNFPKNPPYIKASTVQVNLRIFQTI